MPKFKIGDVIVDIKPETRAHDRTVIGNSSNGDVVYEYTNDAGRLILGSASEDCFVLKPTKKEGWMNVWSVSPYASPKNAIAHGSYIYATKEEALSANSPARQLEVITTIKIEWEE